MSIINYTELQAAIAGWIARTTLTNIPDFVALFEAVANRRLRVRQQETTAELTPVNAIVALPSDYLLWRRVTWTGSPETELDYEHPTYLHALYPSAPQGTPRKFTIEGGNLILRPTDNSVIEFDYFAKIPPLASNATNWLLTSHPDLYLAGCLVHAHLFVKDYEAASAWASQRENLFGEIELLDVKTRGPSAVRVFGATP